MTEPRKTDDLRYSDPRSDTAPQGGDIGGWLGWIVCIAAVILVAVAVFVGINHATHLASYKPFATTGSAANSGMKPPSTTGFGGSSPQPIAVRPVASAHP